MIKQKIFILATILLLIASCGSSKPPHIPIDTKNRTISLYSLKGVSNVRNSPICDSCKSNKHFIKMVNDEIKLIKKRFLSELRRCEKFGLYTVTDSIYPHEISVTLEFLETFISKDTLYIPVKITTNDLNSRQKEIQQLNLFTIIPEYDLKNEKSHLYAAGRALLNYRNSFPSDIIVRKIYNPLNTNDKHSNP